MPDWGDLRRELDAWERAGETATLWWRDDDAVTVTPALQQLIALTLSGGERLPIALAVIPAQADAALAHAMQEHTHVAVLQHGYAHANNAAAGTKKAEFPIGREITVALHELRLGSQRMAEVFGGRALPVLVPPWNRIDPAVVERLPEIGFRGLSAYGPRNSIGGEAASAVVNTHIDIMRWHGQREFLGTASCLDLAIGHLQARRRKHVDRAEATGILTHHLVHDAGAWQFLADFVQRTHDHPAIRWMNAAELFGCGESPVA
jgi:hypothetical protein